MTLPRRNQTATARAGCGPKWRVFAHTLTPPTRTALRSAGRHCASSTGTAHTVKYIKKIFFVVLCSSMLKILFVSFGQKYTCILIILIMLGGKSAYKSRFVKICCWKRPLWSWCFFFLLCLRNLICFYFFVLLYWQLLRLFFFAVARRRCGRQKWSRSGRRSSSWRASWATSIRYAVQYLCSVSFYIPHFQ